MGSTLLIVLIVITSAEALPEEISCNRIKIGEQWYKTEVLMANLGRSHNLNFQKSSNLLFFSYSVPESYSDVEFQIAFYNIDTKEYHSIAGIRGGCAIAIDQGNDEVYLGGNDGIFKYNKLTRIADTYHEKGKNIWSLFYKTNLYYISFPDQKLHVEIDGRFVVVREFERTEVDNFYITHKNDIYMANKTGLYTNKNQKREVSIVNEMVTVRQIIEDNDGHLFVCTNYGVYRGGKYDDLIKIWDSKNIYGLAFDRDNNIIFSDDKSIIRLRNSNVGCDVDPHW